MWVGIVLGALFTPFPTLSTAGASARIGLGVVLLLYCTYGLARPAYHLRLPRGWMLLVAFVVGCGTGFMAAATGVFFFPMVVFLQMLDFDKDEMVQALGISFVVGTVSLAGSLGWGVSWNAAWSVPGVLALVFAFAGMALGARRAQPHPGHHLPQAPVHRVRHPGRGDDQPRSAVNRARRKLP
jgi:uncharacterized membrane protein YfcA